MNQEREIFFVYGPPGSGKSTLGMRLAERLGMEFSDLDNEIVKDAGRSIPEIFAAEGEVAFRERESRALRSMLAEEGGSEQKRVIALGGGALLAAENLALAERNGKVLCLMAPQEVLLARTAKAPHSRPLLMGGARAGEAERLAALLERRAAHYATFALQLDATSDDLATKLYEAMILLGAFRVQGMGKPYDVRVGDGVLEALGRQAAARSWRGQALVVGDSNTAATHGAAVGAAMRAAGFGVAECCLRAGESFKTLESVSRLWQEMLNAGIDRGGTVVAVGGGVVGDLSGFAAATWMRGVRWIGVPTSLLAMVDSSLGGKTAFDLPEGKNLVGAFHPPALVAIDIATLHTLPAVELRCGLAEAVKHGVLGDAALFERFEQLARRGNCAAGDLTSELVARSMAVKIRVIESDPFEKGEREGLNLGHTVGHALEIASGFALRHGEAVAIGMVAEARLAEGLKLAEKGLAERIAQTLRGLGLPTTMSAAFDHEHFMKALQRDKKRRDGAVRYALPRAIGAMELGVSVCPSLLEQVMQSMG